MPYNNVITDDDEDRHLSVNRTRLDDHSSLPEMGACLLTEVLTNLYNSTIRMWPCPSQSQVSSKLYHKFDFSTFLLFSSRTDWNKITLNQIKFKFNWVALIDSWPSLTSTSIFIELGGNLLSILKNAMDNSISMPCQIDKKTTVNKEAISFPFYNFKTGNNTFKNDCKRSLSFYCNQKSGIEDKGWDSLDFFDWFQEWQIFSTKNRRTVNWLIQREDTSAF